MVVVADSDVSTATQLTSVPFRLFVTGLISNLDSSGELYILSRNS